MKSSYSPLAPQAKATSGVTTRTVQQNNDFNTLWNKYGAQLVGSDTKPKATGPNVEMGRTTAGLQNNNKYDTLKSNKNTANKTPFEKAGNIAKGMVYNNLYISPLPKSMNIELDKSKKHSMIMDRGNTKVMPKGNPVFRLDYDDDIGAHINTFGYKQIENSNLSEIQKNNLHNLNHIIISDDIYKYAHNFDNVIKDFKGAGKALAAVGVVLDAFDIGYVIHNDLNDGDRTIGKETIKHAAGVGGSWLVGAAGSQLGTMGGAAIGTMICPGLGTVIGGYIGGIAGGVSGSFAGDEIGEYIVEEIYDELYMKGSKQNV